MNPAHVHLALNHVPILAAFFGILLLGWGSWRKDQGLIRASYLVFVAGALCAAPVYFSGDQAAHLLEGMPGYSEALIEEHEEAAEAGLGAILALGVAALWGLRRPSNRAALAAGALALVTAALLGRAAFLGGQISHPELQPDWKAYRGAAPAGEGGQHGPL